jgi:GABA(A) receptor-associated protein
MSEYINKFKSHSIDSRREESTKIRNKYPDRIPIIVDRHEAHTPKIDKHKFLCPAHISIAEFQIIIRKRLMLSAEDAIFIFLEGKNGNRILPRGISLLSEIYKYNKQDDGFVYLYYAKESTFG